MCIRDSSCRVRRNGFPGNALLSPQPGQPLSQGHVTASVRGPIDSPDSTGGKCALPSIRGKAATVSCGLSKIADIVI